MLLYYKLITSSARPSALILTLNYLFQLFILLVEGIHLPPVSHLICDSIHLCLLRVKVLVTKGVYLLKRDFFIIA
jgi:hypothetical protein